ncbi:MAG TPA: hypothetical protein VFQ34_12105 [Nitrospiraceae bacterium]|nr:hypothetical protein [Nitrospiraceae bacterium]
MNDEFFDYTLNAKEIERALSILQKELQANTPSKGKERLFKYLSAAVFGLGIGGIFCLFSLLIFGVDQLFKRTVPKEFLEFLAVIAIFIVILSVIWSAVILLLFLLNLSYVREIVRQNRLIRSLGLLEALEAPWKTERRKNRLRNAFSMAVRLAGLLVPLSGIMIVGFGSSQVVGVEKLLQLFLLFVFFLTTAIAIVSTYFVWRSKQRLLFLSRLHRSMQEQQEKVAHDEDGRISIPPPLYEKVAQIERAQISRERARTIKEAETDPVDLQYAVQKSRGAQQAQARLEPSLRLRVQNQIDALMAEPRPSGVVEDQTGTLYVGVQDTPVRVGYLVDDGSRRIQVVSVISAATRPASPNTSG